MKIEPVTYMGKRTPDGVTVRKVGSMEQTILTPHASQLIANHSPDGFNFGYGGSGPAQLALALCLDVVGEVDRARSVYQEFKWRVIAKLPQDQQWSLTSNYILMVIEQIESDAETNRALKAMEDQPGHTCVDRPELPCPACVKAKGGKP